MRVVTSRIILSEKYENIGGFRDKLKNFGQKAKQFGGEAGKDLLGGVLGKGTQQATPPPVQVTTTPPPPPPKKGMSKGLKIGLIVGGSLLVLTIIGVVIYKSRKGK